MPIAMTQAAGGVNFTRTVPESAFSLCSVQKQTAAWAFLRGFLDDLPQ